MNQVLAFQITTVEEILRVKPTPSRVSYQSPISFAQFKICASQQDSPVSKTVFTLFSLFFGGPSLRILDHNCGRDFKGEADAITGQLSVTHLFCIVQDLFNTARQSSFQNSFHALLSPSLFFFFSVITTVEETLRVKPTPSQVSYWSPIPCAQFKICSAQQDSPLSKTVSTLFSIPFGEPGLSIPDHNWRHCGWLLVTHLSYTAWDP